MKTVGMGRRFRLYDNGGATIDRYTLLDTRADPDGWRDYIAFNGEPYHPQGFGQHGEIQLTSHFSWRHVGRILPDLSTLSPDARRFALDFIADQANWQDCPCCSGRHPRGFRGDCRDDFNRA